MAEKPKPKPKPKAKAKEPKEPPNPNRRMDTKIEQLDALHERTGVASNLNISSGRRITLTSNISNADPPKPVKRKPKPDFDVKWSVIEDEPASPDAEIDELLSSEDELPDVSTLLSATPKGKGKAVSRGIKTASKPPAKSSPHSSTTYDNSEIDSLIRAVPVDEIIDLSGSQEDEDDKMLVDSAKPATPPPPLPSTKRKGDASSSESSSRSVKRVRYAIPEILSPPHRPTPAREPLFLPDSPGTEDALFAREHIQPSPPRPMARVDEDEDEFVLDESLFNFIDEEPAPEAERPSHTVAAPVKSAPPPPPPPPRQSTEETRRQLEQGFFARQRANAEARGGGFGWATREPISQPVASSSTLSSGGLQRGPLIVPPVPPEPEPEQERDPMEELEEWLATSGQVVWT